jgi:hypothetical protein
VWSGFVKYFANGIVAVAQLSKYCDRKHNPDKAPNEPPTWAKEKSTDEEDAGMRHAMEPLLIGGSDYDPEEGFAHKVKKAWRAMADLERFLLAGNPARAFEPGPGGIRIPLAGGFEPSIATGVSQLDICFACAGAPTPHISTCKEAHAPAIAVSRVPKCKDCGRNIGTFHDVNCPQNFKPAQPDTTLYATPAKRPPTFCTDCGVDLEEQAHATTCLRLNPSRMY